MTRPLCYKLTTISGSTLTMNSIDRFIIEEDPNKPFMRVLGADMSLPPLTTVVAVMLDGQRTPLAGGIAQNIRDTYSLFLHHAFENAPVIAGQAVVYEDQVHEYAPHHWNEVTASYLFESGEALYEYGRIRCLTREPLDNVYEVNPNIALRPLILHDGGDAQPVDAIFEEETTEIPVGTFEVVEESIREHLASTPGVHLLRPEEDHDLGIYGIVVEDGVDPLEVMRSYRHPIVDALRIYLPAMLAKMDAEKVTM